MEKFLNSITPTELSEVYNLLEEIMEALGDGRKPEESIVQFRDRKADELIKHFSDKKAKAEDEEKVVHKQAEHAKKGYHKTPNIETGQKMLDATFNASDKLFKASDASRKEAKAKNIKNKIEWRKNMSETQEILEEIMSELSEATVFPKKTVEQANKKYLEADKEKNVSRRLSKKATEKLMKKGKELRDKGIDPDTDIQPNVNYMYKGPEREYQQAVKTAQSLHDKAREADRKETVARHEQRKLRATGHKGVTMREFEPVATKKGDSHKFARVLRTNEALEILEEILSTLDEGKNLDAVIDRAKNGNYQQRRALQRKYDEEADWTPNLKHPDPAIENIRQKKGKDAAGAELFKDVSAKIPDSTAHKVNKRSVGKKNVFSGNNFTDSTDTNIGNVDIPANASDKVQKNKAIGRHYRKLAKKGTHEALEILEELLFELDLETKQNISPNKVKRLKKNKDGETVEVISVADELFPADGDAKKQYDRKILDKINDMIEGTGTLEDLIQLVKRGIPSRKSVHEGLDEAIDLLETVEKAIEKKYGMDKYDARDFAPNRANDLYGKVSTIKDKLKDKGQGTSHNETKNSKGTEKNEQEQYDKIMNRSTQVDKLVRQIPFKDAVKKSKDRHYRKVIKDSVRSIDKNESLNNSVHEGLFVKDGRRDITQDLGIAEPFKKAKDALVKKAEKAVISKITNEAFDIMEEIINEVSVKKWKEAAIKSLPSRKEEVDVTGQRVEHAENVASLPSSKRSANKVVKAAQTSLDKREEKFKNEFKYKQVPTSFGHRDVPDDNTERNIKRSDRAYDLLPRPKIKGANEAFDIMEEIISELKDETVEKH